MGIDRNLFKRMLTNCNFYILSIIYKNVYWLQSAFKINIETTAPYNAFLYRDLVKFPQRDTMKIEVYIGKM